MMQHFLNQDYKRIFQDDKLPTLVHVCDNQGVSTWHRPLHMHNDVTELLFVSEGSGDFIIGNKSYNVKKGNILIYNRGVLHDEKSNPDYPLKAYTCGMTNLFIKDMEPNMLLPPNVSPVLKSDNYFHLVESLFEFMISEALSGQPHAEQTCQFLLCTILSIVVQLVASHNDFDSVETKTLGYRIKQFIDDNYTKDIKLKDISDNLYISPYYLAHVFKKEVGFSPVQYIINRRIGEAQSLLLQTNMSVAKIAKQVGYENANYFNILFKKTTGVSPGKFRQVATISSKETTI
ncbi:MAG: AraC family transcriptional regulator [Christensenellales bacterium]|jgi:AraC-like DNA-binding protein/mannose-6-phosphate isomerase-like protein (cupin superfamily)